MVEVIISVTLLLCGIILTARLGFFSPQRLVRTLLAPFSGTHKSTRSGISPFSGLCTALGGCVGTGNIIGVTACITLGGVGSIFWIWLCSFFSLATKYSEVYLATRVSKESGSGSPMHYISKYLGKKFMPLAYLWCLLCLLSAVFTGSSVQSNAISEAVISLCPQNAPFTRIRFICGILLAIAIFIILSGGLKRISGFASALVPVMCVIYTGACVVCIILSGQNVLTITKNIVTEALTPKAAVSGSITAIFLRALRLGVSRGIFSNEAGMGTSPLALSSTSSSDPHVQGAMGMWEIVVDTFIICTATAYLVICCVPDEILYDASLSPVYMVQYAFSVFFGSHISSVALSVCIILFAFTSILGWSYYGSVCAELLSKKNLMQRIYSFAFCIMAAAGCLFPLGLVWDVASTFNMILALPNVYALLTITRRQKNRLRGSGSLLS
ncbi:MAG: sodium:alanine symporter family protein [Clostridia bacterium]|nr:sodium:alanine symporter family protein [Clostridia bacterium]